MKSQAVFFTAPRQVEVLEEAVPPLGEHALLIQSLCSAISPGTERLIYRGEFPEDMPKDETLPALQGRFVYPFRYGYSVVGKVISTGKNTKPTWKDRIVFVFHPHASIFIVKEEEVLEVPEDIPADKAIFLPNLETALNLVMDGKPMIGEEVVLFGQGVVGLLTTFLLAQHPLHQLITLDCYAKRRELSIQYGAQFSLDVQERTTQEKLRELLPFGADLVYELSGSPEALDEAIEISGFAGRVVIGSWYGKKRASLNLGGHFHRHRITLISSQVSSIHPSLSGRWDKKRRFQLAWEMLRKIETHRLITHRFPLSEAARAYELLDTQAEESLQIIFTYS